MNTKTILVLFFLVAILLLTGCTKNPYQGYVAQQQYPQQGNGMQQHNPGAAAQPSFQGGGCGLSGPDDAELPSAGSVPAF